MPSTDSFRSRAGMRSGNRSIIAPPAIDPQHQLHDPRRQLPIKVDWQGSDTNMVGRITVGGEYWCAVEWLSRRKAWCIEDAEGRCLTHAPSIHGQAATKEAAEALAREMILDGYMPSPQQAHSAWLARQSTEEQVRERRREKRNQQPSVILRREEARARGEAQHAAFRAWIDVDMVERDQQPLYEALAEAFDFTNPELWKSNSWAMLRPRLVLHQRTIVAKLEYDLTHTSRNKPQLQQSLDRAREILCALEGTAAAR